MKTRLLPLAAAAALLWTAATPLAGPLAPDTVSADAQWVIHVDFDRLQGGRLYQQILELRADAPARQKVEAFKALLRVNPEEDLHGVTVYGPDNDPRNAVAIVKLDHDPEFLTTLIKANDMYEAKEIAGQPCHRFKGQKNGELKWACFYSGSTILIGNSEDALGNGIRTLAGTTDNLRSSSARLADSVPNRSVVLLATADMVDLSAQADSLKHAKSLSLVADEDGDNVVFDLSIETLDAETARRTEAVFRGLIAFAELGAANKPNGEQIIEMIRSIGLSSSGNSVAARLRFPSEKIAEIAAERAAQRGAGIAKP